MLEKLKRCDEGGQQQSSLRVTREPYLFLFFTFFFTAKIFFIVAFSQASALHFFSYFFGCSAMSSSPFPSTAREHILWCFSSTFFIFFVCIWILSSNQIFLLFLSIFFLLLKRSFFLLLLSRGFFNNNNFFKSFTWIFLDVYKWRILLCLMSLNFHMNFMK